MNARRATGTLLGFCCLLGACATAGSTWMAEPISDSDVAWGDRPVPSRVAPPPPEPGAHTKRLGVEERVIEEEPITPDSGRAPRGQPLSGRVLGTFRNTYYDFPSESDFHGDAIALKNSNCKTIKEVASGFYEAVCVQGSGILSSGSTVSFAKRDCDCAAVCPRTQQRICFDELDAKSFPWGRGATGHAITPELTVAVDTDVIPLETAIYIPEFDGAPRTRDGRTQHDGCFIAQDRGVRVKGNHVDLFTGERAITELWNALVPSNQGVTVVLDSPRCARAH
ncbi:MAG TPA: 3D domain-containing protein [Polyangiaceae bacterium]